MFAYLVDKLFLEQGIRIISEPGRFISESFGFLDSKVIGKKVRDNKRSYYVNNGLYQSYNLRLFGEEQTILPLI